MRKVSRLLRKLIKARAYVTYADSLPLFKTNKTICGTVKLLDIMPYKWESNELRCDESIVIAARTSTNQGLKDITTDAKIISYLWENKHSTPFEMCTHKYLITCPLFVAVQWLRHRSGSFNMMSARYIEIMDNFYIPKFRGQDSTNKQGSIIIDEKNDFEQIIKENNDENYLKYKQLLDIGGAREISRCVLPQNIMTKFVWMTNLRNLFHFISLRMNSHAQLEIRDFAEKIFETVKQTNPITTEAYEKFDLRSMKLSDAEIDAISLGIPLNGNKRQKSEFEKKLERLGLIAKKMPITKHTIL